ncbi:MAG: heme ABC exporter ATP-binding protein CcmA [Rubrivivax sp.]|nr:heme ABC exporter ATP-binding protein CcmA [Rubrivivax sp.]
MPSLQAIGLRCERGERALFDGFDLTLAPGEVVWLRGANGRGKTTLMRTLAGLGSAAAGKLRLGGQAVRGLDAGWRRQLVYLGHANALKDDLTAAESLQFAARLAGHACTAAQVQAALDDLGVGALARRVVRTMSQGQRRRVALARLAVARAALAPLPLLALLDEPFDALDDDGIARLARLLAGVAADGGAVLFTSHQQIAPLQPPPRIVTLPEPPARSFGRRAGEPASGSTERG